jgi:hypothetical protein
MGILDWLIVAFMACAILLPFIGADQLQRLDAALTGIAIFGCILMLAWMGFGDGAHSKIWSWLPPFWPWGRFLNGTISRWGLVLMLVAGTVCGIIAERF